jgi:hypothetical protein
MRTSFAASTRHNRSHNQVSQLSTIPSTGCSGLIPSSPLELVTRLRVVAGREPSQRVRAGVYPPAITAYLLLLPLTTPDHFDHFQDHKSAEILG